jgi:hypothetical protein
MLRKLLQAIETADGPVHVAALSRQLNLDHSALEGMIDYWVRKGRLQVRDRSDTVCIPSSGHCGGGCSGAAACPFIARMPKSYRINITEAQRTS